MRGLSPSHPLSVWEDAEGGKSREETLLPVLPMNMNEGEACSVCRILNGITIAAWCYLGSLVEGAKAWSYSAFIMTDFLFFSVRIGHDKSFFSGRVIRHCKGLPGG